MLDITVGECDSPVNWQNECIALQRQVDALKAEVARLRTGASGHEALRRSVQVISQSPATAEMVWAACRHGAARLLSIM